LVETIRYLAVILQVFLPTTARSILKQINTKLNSFDSLKTFGQYQEGSIGTAEVLFERFDPVKKLAEVLGE
jgi:methionyl-tRNA synthetase